MFLCTALYENVHETCYGNRPRSSGRTKGSKRVFTLILLDGGICAAS